MLQFTRLRLAGFKSFVEPAELLIEPGLTGVVGPNGCGKSNLVEALRWVMGETSAKQMRGGEMDDVIFGGTANRPPRHFAEVALVLDNAARTAPAQFNHADELEVVRRIERGAGSLYRVNGRDVRARDVQLLFADAATGARSTAMVSQGRVGAIINAKPSERRGLLEEAAGIGGLHSRRHEAEQRLKAAEANLARVEDVLVALGGQLQSLRRQARQAARYRAIGEQMRAAEALLLHLRWVEALRGLEVAQQGFTRAEAEVAVRTAAAAAVATEQTAAAAAVPTRRAAEAEAALELQGLIAARQQMEAEEGRVAATRRELSQRLDQIAADQRREAARAADAAEALARLEEESAALEAAAAGEAEAQAEAAARVEQARREADALDSETAALAARLAGAEAERAALRQRAAEAEQRRARAAERLGQLEAQQRAALADGSGEDRLADAELAVEAAAEALMRAGEAAAQAEFRHADAQAARERAREALHGDSTAHARLAAEAAGLEALVATGPAGSHPPVLQAISVTPGYEAALGAALGDDLSAPADEPAAALHWRHLPPLPVSPPLPPGVEPLAVRVEAPPVLARRLSQTGVVLDVDAGRALQAALLPGQRLVGRGGELWRWDGFTRRAGAPSPAAVRLAQQNRLVELRAGLAALEPRLALSQARSDEAARAASAAAAALAAARDELRRGEAGLARARDGHSRLAQQAAAAAARRQGLDEAVARLRIDLAEAAAEADAAAAARLGLPDLHAEAAVVAARRAALAEARAGLAEARTTLDRIGRDAAERLRRSQAVVRDSAAWQDRAAGARRHHDELAARRQAALDALADLAERPLVLAAERAALAAALAAAEDHRAACAAALAAAEAALAGLGQRQRVAEQAMATAREERVRREATMAAADQTCRTVAARIAERLDLSPEKLRAKVVADLAGDEPPPAEELERRLDRLAREREAMGPVNLRADTEAAELDQQIVTLARERDDLVAAIGRLRQAIAELNREGRERLLASFAAVEGHFRSLFVRLFGGGRAHLALTESEDPLAAGLEIMASPPGKRLQALSLLSGGEQALTALALLFAVFMANPAPVCVLDEVDAPLDDANVDRFCSLVEELAHHSRTRFLVVTHHRMTMARADRLFGVTMAERGVSQLVSVDLQRADALPEPA